MEPPLQPRPQRFVDGHWNVSSKEESPRKREARNAFSIDRPENDWGVDGEEEEEDEEEEEEDAFAAPTPSRPFEAIDAEGAVKG